MRDFHKPERSLVYAANGMCATSHPLAAATAIDIMRRGGNAVDAAIAGAVLLGICEPQMTGIGGDMFALVHKPGQPVVGLNGSGRAPAGLSAEVLRNTGHLTMPLHDAASVTIPGAVDGFCRLAADHGRLGLDDILAPAIHYAEKGVPVAPRVAFDWSHVVPARDQNPSFLSGAADQYYLAAGKPLTPGQMFRAPGQAQVLRHIARQGRAGFYEGEVAADMVATLKALGGTHELADFAAHASTYVDPISGSYRDHELIELPPNGQGATALLMAGMQQHFDIASLDPLGPQRAHIEAEIAKLAYDARDRFIADETPRLGHMLAPNTARKLADLIEPDRAMASPATASNNIHKDTVYITVVDKDRMVVSLIYSIFHSFGSGIASNKFGILFQNRGAGFTLKEGHPNEAGPGKRPMHTIIPAILGRNDQPIMPFGVMGGAYQPNGHLRFISNLIDFGMDPQTAINAPRSFGAFGPLQLERGYSDATREGLAHRGHTVETPDSPIGGGQAILIDDDVLIGASDPRKDGCALGY